MNCTIRPTGELDYETDYIDRGSATLKAGFNIHNRPIERITGPIPNLCKCSWQILNGEWVLKYIWKRECEVHYLTPCY